MDQTHLFIGSQSGGGWVCQWRLVVGTKSCRLVIRDWGTPTETNKAHTVTWPMRTRGLERLRTTISRVLGRIPKTSGSWDRTLCYRWDGRERVDGGRVIVEVPVEGGLHLVDTSPVVNTKSRGVNVTWESSGVWIKNKVCNRKRKFPWGSTY